jgi:hypothetical protein
MPASQRARRKASTGIPDTNPLERLNKMGYPGQQACSGILATAA